MFNVFVEIEQWSDPCATPNEAGTRARPGLRASQVAPKSGTSPPADTATASSRVVPISSRLRSEAA